MKHTTTHTLGFPRIGSERQLKKALELYWKGSIDLDSLEGTAAELRKQHWLLQQAAGIDWIPCNDFSYYDQTLDTTAMLGLIPERFAWDGAEVNADTLFKMARGKLEACGHQHAETFALDMTKWFDTNYHYLVPELSSTSQARWSSKKIIREFQEAKALGINAKPVLIGPVTYLSLSKGIDGFDVWQLLPQVLEVYSQVLTELAALGATWVQIDEPVLCQELSAQQQAALVQSYQQFKSCGVSIMLATYFGRLEGNTALATALEVQGLHLDTTRCSAQSLLDVAAQFTGVLSLGVVDGRNIWKTDYQAVQALLAQFERPLWIGSSCSLQHAPYSLEAEHKLNPTLKAGLAFAKEKLQEIQDLAALREGKLGEGVLEGNQQALAFFKAHPAINDTATQQRVAQLQPQDYQRPHAFAERQQQQRQKLNLPAFPTTTIGSFPQTSDIRQQRAAWRKGTLSEQDYQSFLEQKTLECIRLQEDLGLDMLVHGEFERTDMVEYFGEYLQGFAFSQNGWVQSYGSRCVKPPIIFGDVKRLQPITVAWSTFAQRSTAKPMKGMLTGPITILQWSFVRTDQPRSTTAAQIALAIRDEVADLEQAGLAAIQIDEPALREGLPLRKSDWANYLEWAVNAFKLSAAVAKSSTQIHTHMCYAEFNDIIEAIAHLDADVITIETSRSQMELLEAFSRFEYKAEIGPGVYDIHSPRVPQHSEMLHLVHKALEGGIPAGNLWINPDCGLKTRGWPETTAALKAMVEVARSLRS